MLDVSKNWPTLAIDLIEVMVNAMHSGRSHSGRSPDFGIST